MEARGLTRERADALFGDARRVLDLYVEQVSASFYLRLETVARTRIPRDPDDWHTVALALAIDADIWTHDTDFFGCGIATWVAETLAVHLARAHERTTA